MKSSVRSALFAVAACAAVSAFAYDSQSYVQGGLIGQWDGIENAGIGVHQATPTTWADLTGKHTDMAFTGTPQFNADNVYFDGSTYYSGTSPLATAACSSGSLTVEMVVETTLDAGNAGAFSLGASTRMLWCYSSATAAYLGLSYRGHNGSCSGVADPSGRHTLRLVANGSTLSVYTNNVLVGTCNSSGASPVGNDIYLAHINGFNSGTMKIYSVRLYNRVLTAEDIALNAKVDDLRFGRANLIEVAGSPEEYGAPLPAYGYKTDVAAGNDYVFSVPQPVYTNDLKTLEYTCTGWALVDAAGNRTSGPEASKTVSYAGGVCTLTWNWTVKKGYFGEPIEVPSDYSTIAAAVAAAEDGDTIVVADGTYEIADQIEVTKAIALKSANGAAVTEIRHTTPTGAMGSKTFVNERCVLIDNADALVDGFAISNGRVAADADPNDNACYGGGVLIYENGGTLANCVVTNCTLGRCMRGGGVAMVGDAAVVTNCTVSGNYTPTVNYPYIYGTGVYMTKGLLVDSIISGNSDPLYPYNEHHGSGVCVNGGTVLRCKISGNRCTRGAAIECSSGAAMVRDCLIVDNANSMSGGGLGGGLCCTTASAEFHNTVFARNQADKGGGVYVTAGAKFYDCVFQDNMTLGDLSAGAPNWYISSAATVLSNCWMEVAAEKTKSTDCRIGRVVFADPDNGDWSRPPFAFYRSSKTQVVGKETVFRAVVRDVIDDSVSFRWKVGDGEWSDYSDDPEFAVVFDAATTVDVSVQAKVGADEQASWTTSVRVAPARIDVAAGGDLAAAVAAAEDGTEIHVAADTYVLSDELVIDKGIRLVGDNGSAVTTIDRKATKSNATNWIIRRAVRINHPDASVEGFTITGGFIYSNITFENDGAGAGVLVGPRGGTLASCRVTGNNSGSVAYGGTLYGAGVGAVGPNSLVTNVTVDGNVALGWISHGGGVFAAHNARVEDCVISGNQVNGNSERVGGGVEAKDATLRRCRISGNAAKKGAGVSAVNASARIENCLIVDNTAVDAGGGVNASAGTFVNCTVVGNTAATGGGVYGSSANVKICNAIIQDNSAGADAEWSGANMVFSNVLTSASSVPAKSYGCEGLYPTHAVFAEDGGYTYKSSKSPGVDVGWNGAIPDIESTVDLSLLPRVFKDVVDLGCYEFRTSGDTLIIDFQPKHARSGSMVTFTADGQSASGATLLYRWHFGEETTAWSTSGETVHSFSAPGVYDILCEIRIDGEEEVLKTVSDTITVSPDNLYVVSAEEHPDHVPANPYASWETAATNLFDALDLAVGGCTVNVSNGVYLVTNSVEITENITFRGVNGAAVTEIRRVGLGKESSYFNDANVNERVLRIDNADAKVCGFTISGGRVSSETIDIVDSYRGGGVLVDTKGGWLYDCAITNCYLGRVASGGGVAIIGTDGVVSNCTISSCLPQLGVYYYYDYGIGAFVKQGVLTHCTFTGFDMRKCVGLTFNRVPGLLLQVTGGRVSHCAFVDNNCTPGGNIGWFCAVDVSGANTVVDNCLIARTVLTKTTDSDYGGALRVTSGTVLNCTVADNQCPRSGGVVARGGVFRNVLASGNVLEDGETAVDWTCFGSPSATYCCSPSGLPAGEGNVSEAVAFRRNYVPKRNSAAIDKGSVDGYEQYLVGGTDLLGKRRIVCGIVDIGCCENQQTGLMLMVR